MKISDLSEDDKFEYTTEKQILIRIRQILYDRKLSGTESNAGELAMLRRKLKDLRDKKDVEENFADGKGPGRAGDSQRHGIPKNATMAQLTKAAKAPGRKGQLARWQINMRRGKKRANESNQLTEILKDPYPLPTRWTKDDDLYVKTIVLPDGRQLTIEINWEQNDKYALVNFYINGDQQITGGGDAFKIFATVSHSIKQFVASKKPDLLAFIGSDQDPSRIKMYDQWVPWMINNGIMPEYKNITTWTESIPDDLLYWIDDIQDPSGKIYVVASKQYLKSIFGENTNVLVEADKILTVMDKHVDVLINPGYQRMLAFARGLDYPVLRALYVPSKDVVIVWAAELGIHYQIAQALVDQLGWNLGPDLKHAMTHHHLTNPMHPQSAILRVEPPLVDSTGKIKRDTNIHKRAGDFSIVALPKFYNIDWWHRIKRTATTIRETWSQKYKKSINCNNPKGFSQRAHCAARKKRQAGGKTTSKPVKENQNTDLNNRLEQAAQQVDLISMPTVNGGKTFIVNLEGRPIVLANFNGHSIPFYCSTGSGGKTDVPTGHWYPFWGIASDGWFNKGSSDLINKFYNSRLLARVAEKLNSTLGNLIGNQQIPMAGVSAVAMINQHQQPMNYVDARRDVIKYYAGISSQVDQLTGNSLPR